MAKVVKASRVKFADEKYLGSEPTITEQSNTLELVTAYNWYNYFYSNEEAKDFVQAYLKQIKYNKDITRKINSVPADKLRTLGWNCRILSRGSLPAEVEALTFQKIDELAKKAIEVTEQVTEQVEPKNVISIQDRIANKASELIGDIEAELDKFLLNNKDVFEAKKWFLSKGIKPQVASKIADYYKPLYAEVFDAVEGKDAQLKEAYSRWKKPALKAYLETLKEIIAQADFQAEIAKATRKPRKKKEQPASKVVGKLNYLPAFEEMGLVSVKPVDILKSNQLWVYNVKTKTMTVYNAMGPAGLSVKGSTLIGFDEKTSITKKLRKPSTQVKQLIDAGKVNLRKYMDSLTTTSKQATGRINKDTVLVRVIK